MRIRILSVVYDDAEESEDLHATRLREQGHEVEVTRIRIPRSRADQSWPSRMVGLIPVYGKTLVAALSSGRVDSILVSTSPPFLYVPIVIRGQFTGEETIIMHYDIFPWNVRAAGIKLPGPLFSILERIVRYFSLFAIKNETLSPLMAESLRKLIGTEIDVKVVALPTQNSLTVVDLEKNRWRKERSLSEKFVVMYAGNFGRLYDFKTMLKAAEALKGYQDIVFVFVGSGFNEKMISRTTSSMGLDNVHLFPLEPAENVSQLLCGANLHVVPLVPGADRVMWPHKIDALVKLRLRVFAVGFDPAIEGVKTVSKDELGMRILEVYRKQWKEM